MCDYCTSQRWDSAASDRFHEIAGRYSIEASGYDQDLLKTAERLKRLAAIRGGRIDMSNASLTEIDDALQAEIDLRGSVLELSARDPGSPREIETGEALAGGDWDDGGGYGLDDGGTSDYLDAMREAGVPAEQRLALADRINAEANAENDQVTAIPDVQFCELGDPGAMGSTVTGSPDPAAVREWNDRLLSLAGRQRSASGQFVSEAVRAAGGMPNLAEGKQMYYGVPGEGGVPMSSYMAGSNVKAWRERLGLDDDSLSPEGRFEAGLQARSRQEIARDPRGVLNARRPARQAIEAVAHDDGLPLGPGGQRPLTALKNRNFL